MHNVLHLHSSSGLYGAESVILNLGKSLDAQGYHPIIGCLEAKKSHLSPFANAARESHLDVETLIAEVKFSPIAIYEIVKLIQKRRIKIIHSHGYKSTILGFFASRVTRIPLVETNHLFPPMPLGNRKLQLYARIEALFLRYADRTVAVSHKIKNSLRASGVPANKICVIANGIDIGQCKVLSLTERCLIRKRLDIKEDGFVIGGVGRLTEQKGFNYLLDAAKFVLAKRKDVSFIIVGDGPLQVSLTSYMHDLKLDGYVKFLGFRKDILEILAAIDLLAMPSIDEGLPMVMLEAMASEVPVIVTAVGEIPLVIKNGENGILIQPRNSEELAAGIIYLKENSEIRRQIIVKGLETVKNKHSKESMTRSYAGIYDELLNSA